MANPKGASKNTRVFCSYSSADRGRVTGLSLLLEALGNEVFLDHRTIKPGSRWEAKLQDGLDEADVLLVYWTRNSSRSDWVRKEIEYFHVSFPDRLLIPILGDETPLTELLKKYQHSDFCPLINELLALKINLAEQGIKQPHIEKEIIKRLHEAGIEIEPGRRKQLYPLFAAGGILSLTSMPALFLHSVGNRSVEALSQLTGGQIASLGVAVASGVILCSAASEHISQIDDGAIRESATKLENSRPSDIWLGMWALIDEETNKKSDTYFIRRRCDGYHIPGKGARVLSATKERLQFQEGMSVFSAKSTGEASAEVEVTSQGSKVISRFLFRKVPGYPTNIEHCDQGDETASTGILERPDAYGSGKISNGSFEIGKTPGDFITLRNGSTDIESWTVTRDSVDYIGSYFPASEGERSLDLAGTPGVGAIEQSFSTAAGSHYKVTFEMAGNPDCGEKEKQLAVAAAGKMFQVFHSSGLDWQTRSWSFLATENTTTLSFINTNANERNCGPLLDNVRVTKQ